MRIGQLAKACDCSVETVRYYEQIGLLSKPARADNGNRMYSDDHRRWLQFVRRSRHLGLSQDEVRVLVGIAQNDSPACADVQAMLSGHLRRVGRKIHELRQLKKELVRLHSGCDDVNAGSCLAIDELLK